MFNFILLHDKVGDICQFIRKSLHKTGNFPIHHLRGTHVLVHGTENRFLFFIHLHLFEDVVIKMLKTEIKHVIFWLRFVSTLYIF